MIKFKTVSRIATIALTIMLTSSFFACKKTTNIRSNKNFNAISSSLSEGITLSSIIEKLPQTILYNLKDSAKFYIEDAQTLVHDDGVVIMFPINKIKTRYLYAIKDNDEPLKVFVRIIYEQSGSYDHGDYASTEEIFNLQTYEIHPRKYEFNKLVGVKPSLKIADPNWEVCFKKMNYLRLTRTI
jgi:hypothetical protein